MATWMDRLQAEMAALTLNDSNEPTEMVGPEDHVAGTASDDLKRLWLLTLDAGKRAREALHSQFRSNAVEVKAGRARAFLVEQEVMLLHERAQLLATIFRLSCEHDFPETRGKFTSMYKGWQLVWRDVSPLESMGLTGEDSDPFQSFDMPGGDKRRLN